MSLIDDYLENVAEPQRAELGRIRNIVMQTIPDAEEVISYGMPGYKYKNKYLITFAAFKDHMSIFPGASPVEAISEKLSGYKFSKGTIQFTIEKPLPESILVEVVKIRQADISKS